MNAHMIELHCRINGEEAGRASFRANVAGQGKRLRAAVKLFRRRADDETSSRYREVKRACGKGSEAGARRFWLCGRPRLDPSPDGPFDRAAWYIAGIMGNLNEHFRKDRYFTHPCAGAFRISRFRRNPGRAGD